MDTQLKRLESGRFALAKATKALILRNGLSHQQMQRLTAWAVPGSSGISTSQISYLRTARVKKIGPETLDSLAQANLALARLAGCDWIETHFADGLGPLPQGLPGLLKMPFFLENPKTGLPIDAGNLFMVSLGLLVLEGIGAQSLSQRDSKELSELLSEYVRQWCSIKDIPPLMVIPQLVMKYPVKEMHRKEMLLRVLLDLDVYYPSELLEEVGPLMVFIEMLGDVPGATGREKLIKALSELKCDSD